MVDSSASSLARTLRLALRFTGSVALLAASTTPAQGSGGDPVELAAATRGLASLDACTDGSTVHVLFSVPGEDRMKGEVFHLRSDDGGLSWSGGSRVDRPQAMANRPGHTAAPQIAALGETLLAVWTMPGDGWMGRGPIAASISRDGGATWQPSMGPAGVVATGEQAFLDLVVDSEDRFHVIWLERRRGKENLKGLYSSSARIGGAADIPWGEPEVIDPETCECCWNRLTYSREEDALYAIYRDIHPRDMSVARVELDGAGGWSRLGFAGAFDWQFEGCPHIGADVAVTRTQGEARLHTVVWTGKDEVAGVYYIRSLDGGETWERPNPLESTAMRPAIASGADGSVLLAWDGRRASGDGGVIRLSLSRDAGDRWSDPRIVSSPEAVAEFPLAVRVPGGYCVLWMERRGEVKSAGSHSLLLGS